VKTIFFLTNGRPIALKKIQRTAKPVGWTMKRKKEKERKKKQKREEKSGKEGPR